MKVHENLERLLTDYSITHHRWILTKEDKRNFIDMTREFLSENSLASTEQRPLAKNKQAQEYFCKKKDNHKWFPYSCLQEQCEECKNS